MQRLFRWSFVILVLGVIVAACDSPMPAPAPAPRVSPLLSPVSPAPTPPSLPALSPKFRLNPIAAGATEVTGQGPVGFTLVVVDVTYGGKQLGTALPDKDGQFRIQVGQPLEPGHLIGLTVDLPAEQVNDETINRQLFDARGEGYRFVPNVVTVFDSHEVK